MPKPDFTQIIRTLEEYSQNLKDNAQIGNSKLILAFAEMIRAMGWASEQADTNNTQIENLTYEIKDLKVKLVTYSSKSDIYTRWLIKLTVALVLIGILTIVVTAGSIWLGYITLQATTDPQVDLTWQHYHPGQDPSFVDATSTVDLTLKNNFFGSIDDIFLYVDYFTVAQDKQDFNKVWQCDWQNNINAIASTSILTSGQSFNFSFPMLNYFSKDSYYETLKGLINAESIVRVRVVFVKNAGHTPETTDFYYAVLDNRTLVHYTNLYLPTKIQTQYGATSRDQLISLLKNSSISDLDTRCSPFMFERLKGLQK